MCCTLEDIEIKLNYTKALLSSNESEKKDKDELPLNKVLTLLLIYLCMYRVYIIKRRYKRKYKEILFEEYQEKKAFSCEMRKNKL